LPGVVRVVAVPPMAGSQPAYAVVARTTWHALRAARALQVAWQPPANGGVDSAAITRELARQAQEAHASQGGFAFAEAGDAKAALATSGKRIQAVYTAPYLAHATLEPQTCTAQVRDGQVTVWAPTQLPSHARAAAARAAGVKPEAVTVHVTYLGGGFGRRLDVDFVAQATRVAAECGGAPVQLVWSREEDTTHDFYRPASAAVMEAGLDANGRPTALAITHAEDALYARWLERIEPERAGALELINRTAFLDSRLLAALRHPQDAPDKAASEGLFTHPYAFAAQRLAHVATRSGVPIGPWRAVGHSQHAFFIESFIDELAHAAQADPVAFRLSLLGGLPRHAAVLRRAAEAAGWGQPLPAGRARGVALHESVGSIVAQVAEVEKGETGPRVRRVVCAIDCGTVINPGQVARQMESAVIFGLTAALYGRIDIRAGRVQQQNFPDYPLLTLADTPVIDTYFIDSEAPPGGVGEAGLPPIAPAVGNAWFALTGERKRELPL
jgi:isoquinoline 1-oxidoreductase beta subunit